MMRKTHLIIGITCSLPLFTSNLVLPYSVIGLIGAIAPDWDFKLHIRHRTITHSLLFLLISTYIIYCSNLDISIVWFVTYSLHLLLDSFTIKGIPLFYPFSKKYYGFKLFKTGGFFDYLFFIFFIYILFTQLQSF